MALFGLFGKKKNEQEAREKERIEAEACAKAEAETKAKAEEEARIKAAEKTKELEEKLVKAKEFYEKEDYAQAFELMIECANNGNPEAQYLCGRMYHAGNGAEKNVLNAIYWIEKAAEQNYVEAQYILGNIRYRSKTEDVGNKEIGLYWWAKAAEQNHESAKYVLSKRYKEIFEIGWKYYNEKNYEEALKWFELSAGFGIQNAFMICSVMYMKGEGTEKNKEKELYWCKKLFNLALELPEEENPNKGYLEAAIEKYLDENYKMACEHMIKCVQGDNINYILKFCWIVIKNRFDLYVEEVVNKFNTMDNLERHQVYFELDWSGMLSKEQKEALDKMFNSISRYDKYLYSKHQLEKSKEVYERARKTFGNDNDDFVKTTAEGLKQAEDSMRINTLLARTEGTRYREEGNYAEAKKYYELLAMDGDAESQVQLAMMYYLGDGGMKNLNKAFSWLTEAAGQGQPYAQYFLGLLYLRGEGTAKDGKQAYKYLKASAEQGNESAIKVLKEIS